MNLVSGSFFGKFRAYGMLQHSYCVTQHSRTLLLVHSSVDDGIRGRVSSFFLHKNPWDNPKRSIPGVLLVICSVDLENRV